MYGITIHMYVKTIHMDSLSIILSSKVRAEIFKLLFSPAQARLHLREIQRRTHLAIGTIQQDIKKLEKLDLVLAERDGNRLYYSANRSHPLCQDIQNLVLKTSGAVIMLKEAFSKEEIQCAFIFGSVAKGKEGARSDIDLIVIGQISLRRVSSLVSKASRSLGREINPHVMTSAEWASKLKSKSHFITAVAKEPKLFIIGDEDVLKKLGN